MSASEWSVLAVFFTEHENNLHEDEHSCCRRVDQTVPNKRCLMCPGEMAKTWLASCGPTHSQCGPPHKSRRGASTVTAIPRSHKSRRGASMPVSDIPRIPCRKLCRSVLGDFPGIEINGQCRMHLRDWLLDWKVTMSRTEKYLRWFFRRAPPVIDEPIIDSIFASTQNGPSLFPNSVSDEVSVQSTPADAVDSRDAAEESLPARDGPHPAYPHDAALPAPAHNAEEEFPPTPPNSSVGPTPHTAPHNAVAPPLALSRDVASEHLFPASLRDAAESLPLEISDDAAGPLPTAPPQDATAPSMVVDVIDLTLESPTPTGLERGKSVVRLPSSPSRIVMQSESACIDLTTSISESSEWSSDDECLSSSEGSGASDTDSGDDFSGERERPCSGVLPVARVRYGKLGPLEGLLDFTRSWIDTRLLGESNRSVIDKRARDERYKSRRSKRQCK